MPKFRKKPVVIEAHQFNPPYHIPEGVINVYEGVDGRFTGEIWTLEGKLEVSHLDWVITGVKGEKYPCKPDIFEQTYDAVTDGEE